MKQVFKNLYCRWYYACVIACFLALYPFIKFAARNPKRYYRRLVRLRRYFSVTGSYLAGIRYQAKYESPIDWSRPYVICPNHTSNLDITAINYLFRQPFSFLGKVELLNNPLTGIFFRSIDIPVDRKQKIAAYRALKKAEALLQSGNSLVVFPEGGIDNSYPPKFQAFKAGAFKLAIDGKIPILPVVIHNAWDLLWDDGRKSGAKPGKVYMTVLKPVETDFLGAEDLENLSETIFQQMNTCWEQWNIRNLTKI